jgi:hypothetical protein
MQYNVFLNLHFAIQDNPMNTKVYKNLNNGKWSIKQRINGKWLVVGYADCVGLVNVTPAISEARFAHVRNGNHREVFATLNGSLAYVQGFQSTKGRELCTEAQGYWSTEDREEITFQPFADIKRGFHWVSGDDLEACQSVFFCDNGKAWGFQ